jgi:hypothetical protein
LGLCFKCEFKDKFIPITNAKVKLQLLLRQNEEVEDETPIPSAEEYPNSLQLEEIFVSMHTTSHNLNSNTMRFKWLIVETPIFTSIALPSPAAARLYAFKIYNILMLLGSVASAWPTFV